jgi:ABC-type multidrug transport system fused ATPase/permease subunit
MGQEEIIIDYRERVKNNESFLAILKRRQLLMSVLRLSVFVAGIAAAIAVFSFSVIAGICVIIVTSAIFLLLVKRYSVLAYRINFTENLININRAEVKGIEGDYSAFDGGTIWKDRNHDFSEDTDLFGEDSLFRYLNRTVTGYGREILAGWFSDPYALRERIEERQEAVIELAHKISWRQEFMAHGFGKPLEKEDLESLQQWMEEKENFQSSAVLKSFIAVSPAATMITLVLSIIGLLPAGIPVILFLINLGITGIFLTRINRVHSVVSGKYLFLSSFERLITSFGNEQFQSQILAESRRNLYSGSRSADSGIKELSRIIQAFDSRLNLFAGFLLNGLVLWDFQCLARLWKWKLATADQLPLWLGTIGNADALISLANHVFNNPSFVLPEFSEGEIVIEATDLGHPLIDSKTRICNDFSLMHKGHICIVTGANMAGKSTFLRAVAVNLILGMIGTRVCASAFRFKPVMLFTSMRTTDSLSSKESYFYAELKRLRILKERIDRDENLFFILDEILKGTNSEDKSTGSKMFLSKIAEGNGTGIIATHDTSLGEMEKNYPARIFNKCFEIEINGETVIFDYKLRDGITKHMNAGILMRQMGII